MSIASEISRLQAAKNALKTKLNNKNDAQHQIDDETLDEYYPYIDSIQATKIFETVQEMNSDTNKQLGDIALVYKSGAEGITENTTFRKFVKSGTVTLNESIVQYLNDLGEQISPGQTFQYSFYSNVYIPSADYEHDFQIDSMYLFGDYNYDEELQDYTDEFIYGFGMYGYFTTSEYPQDPHPMYYIGYTSSDGITFTPYMSVSVDDPETGMPVSTQVDSITSEVDINFSEIQGNWDDIIGQFLFTEETSFGGVYEVQEDANENLVYVLIAPTLQSKSVTITENGTQTITADTGNDGLSQVAITTNVSGAGTTVEENDVNFYDYDGTLVDSYSANDFASLAAMPNNPTHTGLTSQGWNWSLSDAKTYVASYGKLNVGQLYITDDGKTRIYVELKKGRLSPYIGFAINGGDKTATIDWGDGNTQTVTGQYTDTPIYTQHTYANEGNYVIKLSSSNTIKLLSSSSSTGSTICSTYANNGTINSNAVYRNSIVKIELGSNIEIGQYAFDYCYNLKYITMPSYMQDFAVYAFRYCNALEYLTIPNQINFSSSSVFYTCNALRKISFPKIVTGPGMDFGFCQILKDATLPINTGSIYSFRSCYGLLSIIIPNELTTINSYAFQNCYSMAYIKIPATVTTINASTFSSCSGMKYYDFSSHTSVPSLVNTNAFSGIPNDCQIIVPNDLYDTWKSSTNWSTYSNKIIKASEV